MACVHPRMPHLWTPAFHPLLLPLGVLGRWPPGAPLCTSVLVHSLVLTPYLLCWVVDISLLKGPQWDRRLRGVAMREGAQEGGANL